MSQLYSRHDLHSRKPIFTQADDMLTKQSNIRFKGRPLILFTISFQQNE